VDAIGALSDNPHNFVEAQFAGVVEFLGTAGSEAEVMHREQNGFEDRFVRLVEWTIDEYVFAAEERRHGSAAREALTDDGGNRSLDCLASELALARRPLQFREAVNITGPHGTIPVVDDDLSRRRPLNDLTRHLYRFLLRWVHADAAVRGTFLLNSPSAVLGDNVGGLRGHFDSILYCRRSPARLKSLPVTIITLLQWAPIHTAVLLLIMLFGSCRRAVCATVADSVPAFSAQAASSNNITTASDGAPTIEVRNVAYEVSAEGTVVFSSGPPQARCPLPT
jgi:hypothetical protein